MIAGSLYFDQAPLVILPLLFLLVVPFEKLFPRHDQKVRRPHLGLDITYLMSSPFLQIFTIIAVLVGAAASFFWLPGLAIRPLVAQMPLVAQAVVGFLLFDLVIYWAHRWSHEVPFLWRFHSVHHSIETMDWVSPFRNHPLDGLIIGPPIAFLLAAGFSFEITGALAVIQFFLGIFLHANVRWRLRPLQRLVITPEFHHWHHANETGAINTNYSTFLPLWDIIFGTWFMPKNRRPQRYGIAEYMPTTLTSQLTYPLRGLHSPFWYVRHPVKGARHGFRELRSGGKQIWRSTRRPTRAAASSV